MRAQDGWTALIFAAAQGHADCARLLLDAGADKEAKTTNVRASASVVYGVCGYVACGALVEMDWCVRKYTDCTSDLMFYFDISRFRFYTFLCAKSTRRDKCVWKLVLFFGFSCDYFCV